MQLISSWVIGGLFEHAAILRGLKKFETKISNWHIYSPSLSTKVKTIRLRFLKFSASGDRM